MKQRLTPKRITDALRDSKGMVSVAARRVGCARSTVYEYMERYPEIKAALEDERELMTDLTELSLYKQIQAGEGWAVQFYLRTQGKGRGYGDEVRHRVGGDPDNPTPIQHEVKTFGDLVDLIQRDSGGRAPDPRPGG